MRTETDKLPEGWDETPLIDLLSALESGSRPKGGVRKIASGIASIGGEHLDSQGGFRFEKLKFVPVAFHKSMTRGHIHRGDVLVVKDGATTGKVSLVREDFPYDPAVVNEHVFVCRPTGEVSPEFLFRSLFSADGQERILEHFRGAAQGGITQEFAEGTLVPVAPLAEQRRIVAKVEELLPQVNQIRERLARVPAILKRFRQSVLSAACSGRLSENWRENHAIGETADDLLKEVSAARDRVGLGGPLEEVVDMSELPPSWRWVSFGDLLISLRSGTTEVPGNQVTSHPVLRSSSVRPRVVDFDDVRYLKRRQSTRGDNFLCAGDLLFTRLSGSLEYVANCAFVRDMAERRIQYPDRIFCARLAVPPVAEYCECAFGSPELRSRLSVESKSSAGHQRISMGTLTRFPIPLPSMAEQREIVRRVEELFKLADDIEKQVEAATKRVDKLTQAILVKAFRGELVPTEAELARKEGRSYEPAAVLLERIRSERACLAAPSRRRGRGN